jgi:hypothetical protein
MIGPMAIPDTTNLGKKVVMPRNKSTKIEKSCANCGLDFLPFRPNREFCSVKCARQKIKRQSVPLEVRFRKFSVSTDERGCVIWNGPIGDDGYGKISASGHRGKTLRAPRTEKEMSVKPNWLWNSGLHRRLSAALF